MAEALEGLTGYHRIVDDIVIYDKDPQQHVQHVKQFLQQCKDKKIKTHDSESRGQEAAVRDE